MASGRGASPQAGAIADGLAAGRAEVYSLQDGLQRVVDHLRSLARDPRAR